MLFKLFFKCTCTCEFPESNSLIICCNYPRCVAQEEGYGNHIVCLVCSQQVGKTMNIGEYCQTSNYARNKNDKKLLLKRFGYKVMTIYLLQVLIYAHLTCIFNIVTNCDRICKNQTMG